MTFEAEYLQEMLFLENAIKEYILMSDEQEVLCYHIIEKGNSNKYTILFIQGFGSGVYSWTDLWDELNKEFNLIVLDPRDKETIKLSRKTKCTVQRIALDIAEAAHYLKIDKEKLILFGSSAGASYIANSLRRRLIDPKCCFFAGPSVKPRNPKFLLKLAIILPSNMVDTVGKFVGRRYLRNKVAEGFQRKVFFNRLEKIDVRRWKKCIRIHNYIAAEDFKAIECPVYIITTKEDKYHHLESVEEVHEIIENSTIVDVPSYEYYHTKPGVMEFTERISKIIYEQ